MCGLFFFFLPTGFGNIIVIAVSNGTHPGCLHDTCITMTDVPNSSAFSGMVDSMNSVTRRLCCRSTIFSLAENIMITTYSVVVVNLIIM